MEIEKSFKRLLIKNPFYGLFCLSMPKEVTRKIPTLCVSKDGVSCKLNINPDFWAEHTDDEQIALLQHELSHIAFQHMFISDSFNDPQAFNIAADAEVNSYIENLPKSALTAAELGKRLHKHLDNGLGTKKYYEEIMNAQQQNQAQSPQKPCNGGKGGQSPQSADNSSSSDNQDQDPQSSSPSEASEDTSQQEQDSPQSKQPQPQRGEEEKEETPEMPQQYPDEFSDFDPTDDHTTWKDFKNLPEATQQLISNNINSILKQTAEQVEKMRGTIPGEFTEIIEKLREKKPEVFNWKAYFRRLLGSIYDVNIRSTRRKPSKRFEGNAGIQHRKKVSILVAVDTSGSVSQEELQEFFSEIDYVFKAGARVTILQCDTHVNSIEEYDGKNIPKIKGRGGTDFNPPVDYYVEHRKEYASLIYFTDGEAPLPRKNPSGMVWVISSRGCHQDFPGKAIYIPQTK